MASRRAKVWMLIGGAVSLVLVVFLWQPRAQAPTLLTRTNSSVPTTDSSASPSPVIDPVASPSGATREVVREKAGSTSLAAIVEPELPFVVRGRVDGVDPASSRDAVIAVTYKDGTNWGPPNVCTATVDERGTYEVDFTRLARTGPFARRLGNGAYRVALSHATLEPVEAEFLATDAVRTKRADGESALVVIRDLRTESATLVTGRVIRANPEPAKRAHVRLVLPREHQDAFRQVAVVECDGDGGFTMRSPVSGTLLFLAASPAHRPTAREVVIVSRVINNVGEIVLDRGVSLAGSLTVPGGGRPEAFAITAWRALSRGARSLEYASGVELAWDGDDACLAQGSCVPQADGTFEIRGLRAGAYRIAVLPASRGGGGCWLGTLDYGAPPIVQAPDSSLRLTYDVSRIHFVVTDGEEPVARAEVAMTDQPESYCRTSDAGRTSWDVHTERMYAFTIRHPDFEAASASIRSPPAGLVREEHVRLQRLPAGKLEIAVSSEQGSPVTDVALWMHRDHDLGAEFDAYGEGALRLTSFAEDGVHRFENLRAGSYAARIEAQCEVFAKRVCHLGAVDRTLSIQSGALVREPIELPAGGQIRISVKDQHQQFVAAKCGIFDADRTLLAVRFYDETGRQTASSSALASAGPSLTVPGLAPGKYRLVFEGDGFVIPPQDCTVDARRTTDVVVEAIAVPK